MGLVAHNSYVHGFVELGLFGGTLFSGAFCLALWGLYRSSAVPKKTVRAVELERLRPYLTACLVGYMAGMFSLSRNYITPTFLVLGLVTCYMRLRVSAKQKWWRLDGAMMRRLALAGIASVVFLKFFTQVMFIPS
jgi:O-antigen ligase